jgi:hypothetical protein
MGYHVTKAQIERALDDLNRVLGRNPDAYSREEGGRYKVNVGTYTYEHSASGYCLELITNEGGGVTNPLGGRRVTKRELLAQIEAIIYGVKAAREDD